MLESAVSSDRDVYIYRRGKTIPVPERGKRRSQSLGAGTARDTSTSVRAEPLSTARRNMNFGYPEWKVSRQIVAGGSKLDERSSFFPAFNVGRENESGAYHKAA